MRALIRFVEYFTKAGKKMWVVHQRIGWWIKMVGSRRVSYQAVLRPCQGMSPNIGGTDLWDRTDSWSLQDHGGICRGHLRGGAFNGQPSALVHTQTHCLMPSPPSPSSVTEAGKLVAGEPGVRGRLLQHLRLGWGSSGTDVPTSKTRPDNPREHSRLPRAGAAALFALPASLFHTR